MKPIWGLTPLRYIGGKSKTISKFFNVFPLDFNYYREPFLGGGSVFLFVKQIYPEKKYWINDLNPVVFNFWKTLQSNGIEMMKELLKIKSFFIGKSTEEKRKLNERSKMIIYAKEGFDYFEQAISYYITNKTSFSGLEVGKFSEPAFEKNFTISNINKFPIYYELLQDVRITNFDYREMLYEQENTFIYLDPPYELVNTKNILYGKDGELHSTFNHIDFYNAIKETKNKFCISYNSDDFMQERYKDFNIKEIDFMYIGNVGKDENGGTGKGRVVKEVLITNY